MATLSRREQVLSAFFALFANLDRYPEKERMPNWPAEDLPALAQFDGGADYLGGSDQDAGYGPLMRLELRVTLILTVRETESGTLGSDLSEARAEVRELVGADQTLGGLADHVRWDGEDDPLIDSQPGSPPVAVFRIFFVIQYTEAWDDPRTG